MSARALSSFPVHTYGTFTMSNPPEEQTVTISKIAGREMTQPQIVLENVTIRGGEMYYKSGDKVHITFLTNGEFVIDTIWEESPMSATSSRGFPNMTLSVRAAMFQAGMTDLKNLSPPTEDETVSICGDFATV